MASTRQQWLTIAAACLFVLCSFANAHTTHEYITYEDSDVNAVMPCPFSRQLSVQSPLLSGNDVFILQNLLLRSPYVAPLKLATDSIYGANTAAAVSAFQTGHNLAKTGIFDAQTASLLLKLHSEDGYVDDGAPPPVDQGILYKVYVPVHRNRSVETVGTVYGPNNVVLATFPARTHGQNDANGNDLSEFCGDGNTPTGLTSFDLNTPEDDVADFGPYNVNRAVQGIKGNAAILLSNIRSGILLHTGQWPYWTPDMPMPNSHGCIHSHPASIWKISEVLQSIGVVAHLNPYGQKPYPFKTQGLLSVELVD